MQINLDTIIKAQDQLKAITEALKANLDGIQKQYEANMVEIVKVLDQNQKNHATSLNEINKVIDSILNRK